MPERWETELRRLRAVDAPPSLEDRMREGPRHEPGRPTRDRVAAAVVAFAVCAAVAVVGIRTLTNDGSHLGGGGVPAGGSPLVLRLIAGESAPDASVSYGAQRQDVVVEGYEWCDANGQCASGIASFATWPPSNAFTVVPGGTPVSVEGDGSVDTVEVLDPAGDRIRGLDGSTTPPDDGRYVFHVSATFPRGSASLFFGVQTLNDPAAAPDTLTLDCSMGFARTDTSIVSASPDGVHVHASGAADGFAIGSADGSSSIGAGSSTGAPKAVLDLQPGLWLIGCGDAVDGDSGLPFEVIDPDDVVAPTALACDGAPETGFVSSFATTTPDGDVAPRLVTGLVDGDRLRGAGYGAGQWKLGPTYVVDRGGQAIARLVLGERDGSWGGTFSACEGSGIALSDAAVAGASGSTSLDDVPTTLVVRCEGLGAAVDASEVRLQPDGLHVEATNVADAEVVVLASTRTGASAGPFPFDRVTERVVVANLTPGRYAVGCLVAQPDGTYASPSETPDAYVDVEVLPPNG